MSEENIVKENPDFAKATSGGRGFRPPKPANNRFRFWNEVRGKKRARLRVKLRRAEWVPSTVAR